MYVVLCFQTLYNGTYCTTYSALLFSLTILLLRFIRVHVLLWFIHSNSCMVFPCMNVPQFIFLLSCWLTLRRSRALLVQTVLVNVPVWVFLWERLAGLKGTNTLAFTRWHWTLPHVPVLFHAHTAWRRVAPQSDFSFLPIWWMWNGVSVLLCISLIIGEARHLLRCLLAVCIMSSVNCLPAQILCSFFSQSAILILCLFLTYFEGVLCVFLILILCQWCVCGVNLFQFVTCLVKEKLVFLFSVFLLNRRL